VFVRVLRVRGSLARSSIASLSCAAGGEMRRLGCEWRKFALPCLDLLARELDAFTGPGPGPSLICSIEGV